MEEACTWVEKFKKIPTLKGAGGMDISSKISGLGGLDQVWTPPFVCDDHSWNSWPSSPPHWLSRKRNTGHVKPPSPSYFTNFRRLHLSNGLIDRMLAAVDGFSHALVISVFDSLWMYCFCGVLTSLFYVLLVTFYFLLVFYRSPCSSLIFTWP